MFGQAGLSYLTRAPKVGAERGRSSTFSGRIRGHTSLHCRDFSGVLFKASCFTLTEASEPIVISNHQSVAAGTENCEADGKEGKTS